MAVDSDRLPTIAPDSKGRSNTHKLGVIKEEEKDEDVNVIQGFFGKPNGPTAKILGPVDDDFGFRSKSNIIELKHPIEVGGDNGRNYGLTLHRGSNMPTGARRE